MNYVLTNKNTPVLLLDIDNGGHINKIIEEYDTRFLPFGVKSNDISAVREWWGGRSIPMNRDEIKDLLIKLDLANPQELLVKNLGLGLSDQYWIKPEGKNIAWKDVNFFDNDFQEDMGKLAFNEKPVKHKGKISTFSPDSSSNGWLKKKWIIKNGARCLVKSGSGYFRQEPFNEVVASHICKKLDIPAAPYQLYKVNEQLCCICKNFITPDTELVPAWYVNKVADKAQTAQGHYNNFIAVLKNIGIQDAELSVSNMLVLDYIIANKDRHWGNFGLVRNVENLQFVSFAPIYDNGTSLWHDEFDLVKPPESKTFHRDHDEQIKLVKNFSNIDIKQLKDIAGETNEIFKQNPRMDSSRRSELCRALARRVEMLEKHILQSKNLFFVKSKLLDQSQ